MQIRFASPHLPLHWNICSKEMKYGFPLFSCYKLGRTKQNEGFEAVNTSFKWRLLKTCSIRIAQVLAGVAADVSACLCCPLSLPRSWIHVGCLFCTLARSVFIITWALSPKDTLTFSLLCGFLQVCLTSPPPLLPSCTYSPGVCFPFGIYCIPSPGVLIPCHMDHLLPGVPSSLSHRLLLHVGHFWLFQCWLRFSQLMPWSFSYIIESIRKAPWPFAPAG